MSKNRGQAPIVALRAGLMVDDRGGNNRQDWLDRITADLPDQIRHELDQWWHIMIDGSRKPPRRRPRDLETAQTYLRSAMPALSTWAEQGVASLREVTSDGVRQVLPASGNPRSTMGLGLRSIFTVLKGTKTIFLNPIARIPTGRPETTQPLPVDTDQIREALNSTDSLVAAVGALAAFHALRTGDILQLHLTDLADGRLQLDDRRIPLAAPVLSRLRDWLDSRDERWPETSNPHLFINQYTALRATPMHRTTLRRRMPINIQDLREDRLLAEGIETNGDVRQMGALFGLDVQTALRYAPPPDPDEPAAAPGHR